LRNYLTRDSESCVFNSCLETFLTPAEMEGGRSQEEETHTTGMSVYNLLATPTKEMVFLCTERVVSRSRSASMVISPTFGETHTVGKRERVLDGKSVVRQLMKPQDNRALNKGTEGRV
jgi:hypothetical protein